MAGVGACAAGDGANARSDHGLGLRLPAALRQLLGGGPWGKLGKGSGGSNGPPATCPFSPVSY